MATTSRAVSVTTTATRLDAADTDGIAGRSILIYNDGANTVYVGGPAVTSSGATKGIPVAAGAYGPAADLHTGDTLYAITASSTSSVLVLEVGV